MVKKSRVILNGTLKQEFQKDLELFKHFLLMVNKSGPIRNVELMWKEENEELEPSKDRYKSRVGTEDALVELQPAGSIPGKRNSPSSLFCDLVHGYGTHEEGTCAKSDVPAKRRCEQTGCSQVYSCHVGLTDIAVPVICDEEYLGTLFSGQVLTHAPTPEGFRFVRENLAGQSHINMKSLETAYYRVPVVDQTQVAEMVRVLELFARYLVNSWKRLKIMGDYQRTHDRELALNRKELASILLSGELGDGQELNAFARRSGMQCLPNRVMVMQIAQMGENSEKPQKLSERMTLNRMSHLVEDNCQNWANTLSMMVRPGEVCIFTSHESRNAAHERISLQEMAQSMLNSIREQAGVTARIGISAAHRQPVELMHAYLEACAALDSDSVSITFFQDPASKVKRPMETFERLVKALQQGSDTKGVMREFLAHAVPSDHSPGSIQKSRALLTWGIEHMALEVIGLGTDREQITVAKEQALSGVLNAPSPFAACEAFRRFAEMLARQIASTFSQREQKIVNAIHGFVEKKGIAEVKIKELSEALHLSTGHVSRVFRRTTGTTLEEYLIRQRVELAKRTLLDPRLNVAEVAERCGFCNPAYFASVFKKYVKCTPRQFATQPYLWTSSHDARPTC